MSRESGAVPSASDCGRAVSTAYYALFDCLCARIASRLTGATAATSLEQISWLKVYRVIDHKQLRNALIKLKDSNTNELEIYSLISVPFNKLLEARAEADYNRSRIFSHDEALQLIEDASECCDAFGMLCADFPNFLSALIVALFIKSDR